MQRAQAFLVLAFLFAAMPVAFAQAEDNAPEAKSAKLPHTDSGKPGWHSIQPKSAKTTKTTTKASKTAKSTKGTAKVVVKDEPAKGATKPISDFEVGKYQYCGDDRDCVLSINGCCDCANGGKDVAVNKERLEAFRSRFDCLNVNCGEKTVTPSCASGVISCINHKCRYISEPPAEEQF